MVNGIDTFECRCKGDDIFCNICGGTGVLDWIENIVGKHFGTSINKINTRMFAMQIEKIVEQFAFEIRDPATVNEMSHMLRSYLEQLKCSNRIYDYDVNMEDDLISHNKGKIINITVQPSRTVELVNVTCRLML